MTVFLVGAGPGDPGLITRRGAEVLARADVVVYDRLIDHSLLALAPSDALFVDAGKRPAGAPGETGGGPGVGVARQDDINALLITHGRAGATVVRLKGGDPFLFGRGGEEADALSEAGVPWEVIPGVTSNGMPAAARASHSSPPRPKTNGSPPLRRTTRLPSRAFSTRRALIRSWVME